MLIYKVFTELWWKESKNVQFASVTDRGFLLTLICPFTKLSANYGEKSQTCAISFSFRFSILENLNMSNYKVFSELWWKESKNVQFASVTDRGFLLTLICPFTKLSANYGEKSQTCAISFSFRFSILENLNMSNYKVFSELWWKESKNVQFASVTDRGLLLPLIFPFTKLSANYDEKSQTCAIFFSFRFSSLGNFNMSIYKESFLRVMMRNVTYVCNLKSMRNERARFCESQAKSNLLILSLKSARWPVPVCYCQQQRAFCFFLGTTA